MTPICILKLTKFRIFFKLDIYIFEDNLNGDWVLFSALVNHFNELMETLNHPILEYTFYLCINVTHLHLTLIIEECQLKT